MDLFPSPCWGTSNNCLPFWPWELLHSRMVLEAAIPDVPSREIFLPQWQICTPDHPPHSECSHPSLQAHEQLFSLPLGLGLCSSERPSATTPYFRARTKQ